LNEDGNGIDDWTENCMINLEGLELFYVLEEFIFEISSEIVKAIAQRFQPSSEFGEPVISVIFLILRFDFFSCLSRIFRSFGVSSVLGKTELGFHDEPEH
jgi:hypothetical protein